MASPTSATSSAAPTIHSIPTEILVEILEAGANSFAEGSVGAQERRNLLLATSLVCRDWVTPSQQVLWSELDLRKDATAELVLASPLVGKFTTTQMQLFTSVYSSGLFTRSRSPHLQEPAVKMETTEKLILASKGLRNLVIHGHDGQGLSPLNFNVLSSPHLKGLTHMSLREVTLHENAPHPVPYHLKSLKFSNFRTNSSTPYTSLAPYPLRSFSYFDSDLLPSHDVAISDFLALIEISANHLVTLQLDLNKRFTLPCFLHLFASFTKLQHLIISCSSQQLPIILGTLQVRLETFRGRIFLDEPDGLEGSLRESCQSTHLPKVMDLEVYYLTHMNFGSKDKIPVSEEVVVRYKERGTELDWRWGTMVGRAIISQ